MIQITLTFNSMDAARKALLEMPESLLADVAKTDAVIPASATTGGVKGEPAKKEVTKAAPVDTQATAETSAAPEQKADPSAPVAVEYPVLQKAVFALAAKSREAAAGVAASFGVKTFKELPEDKWADALAAVNAKIAEV